MDLRIRPYTPADLGTLRALIERPELAAQFDIFVGARALEQRLADPRLPSSSIRLGFLGDAAVGFGFSFVLPSPHGDWASPRVGVVEAHRRRGFGRRLLAAVVEAVEPDLAAPRLIELSSTAWVPDPPVEAFARSLGFRHDRWFWLMERPRGGAPEPSWPAGVTTRGFDRSERALEDWNRAYNESFAEHYHYTSSTLDDARALANGPGFRADGVMLAYRDERCVGFCRGELHQDRGEVGSLGVAREARGIGLGRALLRWGVRWVETATPLPVTLMVDGENENALALYRSEGFEVTRRREVWVKRLDAGRA